MLFETTSKKSMAEIETDLKASADRRGFGVVASHDLKYAMRERGVDYACDCMLYDVCSPKLAARLLRINTAAAAAFPCHIAVHRSGDEYKLTTFKPTELLKSLSNSEMAAVLEETEQAMIDIVKDAAAER